MPFCNIRDIIFFYNYEDIKMKWLLMLFFCSSVLFSADSLSALQYAGVSTAYNGKTHTITRKKDPQCAKIGVTLESVLYGRVRGKDVPKACRKVFVTTLGVIQPMKLDKEIETVGELEVLALIQALDFDPESYILIDARAKKWFREITIPHSVNIPTASIAYDEFNLFYEENLKHLNITKDANGTLDFSQAKEAIIYCNAAWCTQSDKAIKELIKLGYPKKKLKWYRGGLQDWMSMGFSVVRKGKYPKNEGL